MIMDYKKLHLMNRKKLNFKRKKICIVGDILLDQYIIGSSNRLSPESPVPVIDVKNKSFNLGGAGNVALNIKTLDSEPYLFGAIGNDEDGKQILAQLKINKIKTSNIIKSNKIKTIKKTRVISNGYQIVRYDEEEKLNFDNKIFKIFKNNINQNIKYFDIIIISNYGKGFCHDNILKYLIQISKKYSKKIIVDPSRNDYDYSLYNGTYLIKPNISETKNITKALKNNDKSISKSLTYISKKYKINIIVITRGEKGISYKEKNNKIKHLQTIPVQVYDVSGAGDTVIATLSVMLSNQHDIFSSLQISNIAGSIAVSKFGTKPITSKELLNRYKNINEKNI